jgi:hypothetical protein
MGKMQQQGVLKK